MNASAQDIVVDHAGGVVYDALGIAHPLADDSARIGSLVPSITELLCDLGLGAQLVARTGFCIHPKHLVRDITKVGGTKDVNLERLRELGPTHVIVNIDENERPLYDALTEFVPHVFVTHPITPQDNVALFESLGALFGKQAVAAKLIDDFTARREELGKPADYPQRSVLYLIWKDPWMAVNQNTYVAEMLKLINWQVACGESESRYPEVVIEEFAGQVDYVLLSSEPYSFREKHLAEVRQLVGADTGVCLVDGEILSWYGSRAIHGLAYLRTLAATETI